MDGRIGRPTDLTVLYFKWRCLQVTVIPLTHSHGSAETACWTVLTELSTTILYFCMYFFLLALQPIVGLYFAAL